MSSKSKLKSVAQSKYLAFVFNQVRTGWRHFLRLHLHRVHKAAVQEAAVGVPLSSTWSAGQLP